MPALVVNESGDASVLVCLRMSIVVGLILSGSVHHMFCACGCSAGVERATEQAGCPHCSGGEKDESTAPAERCNCRPCQVVNAVPAAAPVKAPTPQRESHVSAVTHDSLAAMTVCPLSLGTNGLDPPGLLRVPSCGLPVLFEHLLF